MSSPDVDLFESTWPKVRAAVRLFAWRRLRNAPMVDDFTHDVALLFLEAVRGGRVREPAAAAGYVLGICRNLARDRARGGERRSELRQVFEAEVETSSPPTERDLFLRAHIEDCLSSMTPRARDVLRLSWFEDHDADELASRIGSTAGNARVMRHRAFGALRECLQSNGISWAASA